MILHSPTERGDILRQLDAAATARRISVACSSIPEHLGADFAWMDYNGDWRGVQRKEFKDFLASLDDGRLAKEIGQLRSECVMPVLVVEGRIQVVNGVIPTGRYRADISYVSFVRRLLTLADRGIHTLFASDPTQTAAIVCGFFEWSQRERHSTGSGRPAPTNDWGTPTNRDFQVHLLQGLDGVGSVTANAILDTLGRCPLRVDASVDELMTVPGVGARTARRIVESINGKVDAKVHVKVKAKVKAKAKARTSRSKVPAR